MRSSLFYGCRQENAGGRILLQICPHSDIMGKGKFLRGKAGAVNEDEFQGDKERKEDKELLKNNLCITNHSAILFLC